MKYFLFLMTLLIGFFSIMYIEKVRILENIIFHLYISSFDEYMYIDETYNIKYDKEKLKLDLDKKGYNMSYKEDNLCFTINFKKAFLYEKEYCFYLVKNDEIK